MTNQVQDIQQKVVIDAPIHKVWEYVASADGIASWFMPNDFQPIIGYEFHLQSPFGPSPCKVIEINEPNKLSFTWDVEGWVVHFILKEIDEQTEFTLIHGGWKSNEEILAKPNKNAADVRETMNNGWSGILLKLQKVVTA